jgi:LAGLIDADG DNA endonuclease family/Cytochrome C oxidase subunit II, transmembrane domain
MLTFLSFLSVISNDLAQPWELGFQDDASPGFTGIVDLHNTIFFYLVIISIGVFWVLGSIIYYYKSSNSLIVHKYLNHGTLIELIWTITPALILIAIAFPSFRLLYLLDEVTSPTITIKVTGFLRNGLKSYILNKIKDTWRDSDKYIPGKKNIIFTLCSLTNEAWLDPRPVGSECKKYKPLNLRIALIRYIQQINDSNLKTNQVTNNETSVSIKKHTSSMPLQNHPKVGTVRQLLCMSPATPLLPLRIGALTDKDLPMGSFAYHSNKYFHTQCRAIKRIGPHNIDVISVIFGLLLGDAYASYRSGEGVRISIKQRIIHKEYLFSLYEFFLNRGYCNNNKPREYIITIRGRNKQYYRYEFNTFTFRSFMWIYELFYKNGKKIVSLNIENYITPLTLAIWISDDGSFFPSTGGRGGVRIACNSFKLEEVEYLTKILREKFDLDCTIQKIYLKDKFSIYIKKNSIVKLENLIIPYLHISMHYKLGLLNQ